MLKHDYLFSGIFLVAASLSAQGNPSPLYTVGVSLVAAIFLSRAADNLFRWLRDQLRPLQPTNPCLAYNVPELTIHLHILAAEHGALTDV